MDDLPAWRVELCVDALCGCCVWKLVDMKMCGDSLDF